MKNMNLESTPKELSEAEGLCVKLYQDAVLLIDKIYGYQLVPADAVVLRRIVKEVVNEFVSAEATESRGNMSRITPISEVNNRFFRERFGFDSYNFPKRKPRDPKEIGMLAKAIRERGEII